MKLRAKRLGAMGKGWLESVVNRNRRLCRPASLALFMSLATRLRPILSPSARSTGGASLGTDDGTPEAGAPSNNLEPTADCRHPEVREVCADGFCRIEPGCFIMGAPRDEWGAGRYSDVQVQVTLTRPFLIGQKEVTYGEWRAEGFADPKRDILDGVADCREDQCPISNLSLFDAISFANSYSERRGLTPCYELRDCTGEVGGGQRCRSPSPGAPLVCEGKDNRLNCQGMFSTAETVYDCTGYRLPTEAEWEYAARAGTRTAFWTGAIQPGRVRGECQEDQNLLPIAWYCANAGGHAHAVGMKPRNPWGLRDMLGNVQEWTTDIVNGLGYGIGPLIDPIGSILVSTPKRDLMPAQLSTGQSAKMHGFVARGGCFILPSAAATADERIGGGPPDYGDSCLGLRLARTAPR